jgi:hypothetical protein
MGALPLTLIRQGHPIKGIQFRARDYASRRQAVKQTGSQSPQDFYYTYHKLK